MGMSLCTEKKTGTAGSMVGLKQPGVEHTQTGDDSRLQEGNTLPLLRFILDVFRRHLQGTGSRT